ncbi:hypothetical protein Dsin_023526 [Dipteronia sinensis]|uniref:Disease resistance N-terminal domain-containing protein n=1 Tax=Dipteronia sinensis TaxID=43782 RepID=A0AAE0E0Z2_9ROSI|nr:hypothetical protein Dsin_023526 [Dipteronia sinensis]
MALAMAIISPFLGMLQTKLASPEMLRFVSEVSIGPKLKKWEPKLLMIQAAMEDAQEKQLTTSAMKMWLDNLQNLVYDMEDILDEIFTDSSRRMLEAKH